MNTLVVYDIHNTHNTDILKVVPAVIGVDPEADHAQGLVVRLNHRQANRSLPLNRPLAHRGDELGTQRQPVLNNTSLVILFIGGL